MQYALCVMVPKHSSENDKNSMKVWTLKRCFSMIRDHGFRMLRCCHKVFAYSRLVCKYLWLDVMFVMLLQNHCDLRGLRVSVIPNRLRIVLLTRSIWSCDLHGLRVFLFFHIHIGLLSCCSFRSFKVRFLKSVLSRNKSIVL